jgi:hypothetical protein
MLDSAPRLALYCILTLLCLGLTAGSSKASQCSDVYPDARRGPPPEWTFWADGSACYVRWAANEELDEKALIAQCRNTPGVRFVHFEPDNGAGHSICIFKLLNAQPASDETISDDQTHVEAAAGLDHGLHSTHYRKADAENPLLDEIELLVTSWTEKCLKKEKIKNYAGAGQCWKSSAAAIDEFTAARHGFLTQEFERKFGQLRTAWLRRADQLQPRLVKAASNEAGTDSPTSTRHDGPDPKRLVETAACSSINLGNAKKCLRQPVSTGPSTYSIALRSSCKDGVVAAIKTLDARGRCIRQVVAILPQERRSGDIKSYTEPAVLDAISYRDTSTYECYSRRHDQISCNGKVDYGISAMLEEEVAHTKIDGEVQRQALRTVRVQPSRRQDQEPSFLTTLTRGLKKLFKAD